MTEMNAFGASGGAKQETSSGSSGHSGPSISMDKPDESVVNFIFAAMEANGGLVEYPIFAEDGTAVSELLEVEIPEAVREMVEALPDHVETLSVEDFFNANFSEEGLEYAGTVPLLNEGDKGQYSELSDEEKAEYTDDDVYSYGDPDNGMKKYIPEPEWVEIKREGKIKDDPITETNQLVNGYFYPEFVEAFDNVAGARFKAGSGRDHNHKGEDGEVDEFSKRKHIAFAIEDGKSSADKAANAMRNVGVIDENTYNKYETGGLDMDDLVETVKQNRE